MSETSDIEKQAGGVSPNVKIIAALIIGLLLGAWANDEFDKPRGKYEFMFQGQALIKVSTKTGEAWTAPVGIGMARWTKIADE